MGSLVRLFKNPVRCLRDLQARYGSVVAVSGGDPALVCVFGGENNKRVLSEPDVFQNAAELPVRIPPGSSLERLNKFLVGMNGETHQSIRRLMMPLFQKTQLETYRDDIVSVVSRELDERWQDASIDLSMASAELALCVSLNALWGLQISADTRELALMSQKFVEHSTNPAVIALPLRLPGTPYRSFLELCDQLEERLNKLIEDRRKKAGAAKRDALSLLLAAHDDGTRAGAGAGAANLDAAVLIGLANELFIAGHKTTASTLAWTLFLLERHPNILRELREELDSVLKGEAPTIEQLDRLPILDSVVKESMRVLPASPLLFFRRVTKPSTLDGFELPAGAALVISPFVTHHLAELYPNPLRFNPERWRRGDKQPSVYEYLPFGAGPRTCLGVSFANMALRVMLSLIVQRFTFTVEPGTRVDYRVRGIILGTNDKLPVRVRRRNGESEAPRHPISGSIHELVRLANETSAP